MEKIYINDYETRAERDYEESVIVKASDFSMINNKHALWQAIVGELKTRKGECQGVGLESYGCNLHKFLGQNIDSHTMKEIDHEILSITPRYPMVDRMETTNAFRQKDGSIAIKLTVYSDFGKLEGGFSIG